nr:alanine--glyoxylate aminotransferase family protein [Chloroflexota bacterium]
MADHVKLFLPGPTEVRAEIRQAQTQPMIGHRSTVFLELFARVQEKLRRVFYTNSRVYVSTSSGTGIWEGASRNCVRDDKKVLHFVQGSFSERWAYVSQSNGKQTTVVDLAWGKAVRPEMVREALRAGGYDALALVHNETSTGVMNPLYEIAEVMKEFPDVFFMVDAVSSAAGVKIEVNKLGIDVLVASSQKCFALPPGLSFAPVSDRVLERAKTIPYRGYYFDFLALEEQLLKNSTPATPAVSLIFALDKQLDGMLAEGLEARFARHAKLAALTRQWAKDSGFELFAEPGYESDTVTTVANTRGVDVPAMQKFVKGRGMQIDGGYGKIKGKTFRIAHMGDATRADFEELFAALNDFLMAPRA